MSAVRLLGRADFMNSSGNRSGMKLTRGEQQSYVWAVLEMSMYAYDNLCVD